MNHAQISNNVDALVAHEDSTFILICYLYYYFYNLASQLQKNTYVNG